MSSGKVIIIQVTVGEKDVIILNESIFSETI